MLSIIHLFIVSYLLFVFISECFNPFGREPARVKRPQLKLGKATAIASLAAGGVAIITLFLGLAERPALVLYLILTIVFLIPSFLRFQRSRIWLS